MIRGAAIAVGMLLALLAVGATPAHACSCMMPGPSCQAFWKTAAVFDATVVGIERTSREDTSPTRTIQIGERLVKLDVRRSWKGVEVGPVEVVTNEGGGSCGFDFKIGTRYLVFAERGTMDGRLQVSICNLTREFDGTGDAADFLASLAGPEQGGRVFGSVNLQQTSFKSDGPAWTRTPMDLVVRLAGEGRTRTMTASGGRYEFKDLAAGHYEIGITLPEGYSTWKTTQEIDIPNPRACAQTDFLIDPAGRIVGQVVDMTQRGIPRIQVEVTREDATGHPIYGLASISAQSDGSGYFEVRNLPPGRYIAGVNLRDLPNQRNPYPRIVYPGLGSQPHVIDLSLGQVADLGLWQLTLPLAVVQVAGSIVWSDGTPAAGVYVGMSDVTGNPVGRARGAGGATAGTDGRFVIEAREGRAYTFMARAAGNGAFLPLAALRIDARRGLEPIRLVIQRDPPQ